MFSYKQLSSYIAIIKIIELKIKMQILIAFAFLSVVVYYIYFNKEAL